MSGIRVIGFLVPTAIATTVLVIAAVLMVRAMDLDQYRVVLENEIYESTGRRLTVAGGLGIDLSLTPRIVAYDLSLANADWADKPEMLRIKKLEIVPYLLPLLSGELRIKRVRLRSVDLVLETDGKGHGNWVMRSEEAAAETAGSRIIPSIETFDIAGLRFTYRNGKSEKDRVLHLDHARLTAVPLRDLLDVELEGKWNDHPARVVGRIAGLKTLVSGNVLPLELSLYSQGLELKAQGRLNLSTPFYDLRFSGKGNDLNRLKFLAEASLPEWGRFEVNAKVTGNAGVLSLEDLDLKIGSNKVAGRLGFDFKGERPHIGGRLFSRRLGLDELLISDKHQSAAGKKRDTTKVFSDDHIGFDWMRVVDATLEVRLGSLALRDWLFKDVHGRLRLQKGRLDLDSLSAVLAGGKVRGRFGVDSGEKPTAFDLDADGTDIALGRQLRRVADLDLFEARADIKIKADSRGNSVARIMAGMSGELRILIGEGKIESVVPDSLVGGTSKLIRTLFAKKSESAKLNCAAGNLLLNKGVATTQVLLVDTEYATLTGDGQIDFGREALDLMVRSKPKSATLNMAVPVLIGGTFSEPSYTPEKLATARKVGGLLGALVNPAVALVGLAELGSGGENPCLKLVQEHTLSPQKYLNGNQQRESPATRHRLKKAVQRLGDKIKNIFGN